jgi:hypothetical protein
VLAPLAVDDVLLPLPLLPPHAVIATATMPSSTGSTAILTGRDQRRMMDVM